MPVRSSWLEFLIEHLSPLGVITSRTMFGGHCLYCDGTVFALVARNALFLKADEANRASFEARGLKPFRPFEGTVSMSYYEAPPELFEDSGVMKQWCSGSVEAGRKAQAGKRKKASRVKQ